MKTPAKYAQYLSDDIGSYAAKILCNTIIRLVDKMEKPEYTKFDCLGVKEFDFEGEYPTHLTGYDLKEFFKEVKKELKWVR